MLTKKNREIIKQVELVSIDSLVPEDHLLRAVEESIDFSFIYDEVKDLYSENTGRPSIDPVVLIKLLMLQALYGIRSMRHTIKEGRSQCSLPLVFRLWITRKNTSLFDFWKKL